MKIHIPIVLFFAAGMVPTKEELAQGLAVRARFRNAALDDGNVEKCDYVMGEVPSQYADVPRHGASLEEREKEASAGEPVGAFFLHQVERGKWNVQDEDGNVLNEKLLNKADARALALENTEED